MLAEIATCVEEHQQRARREGVIVPAPSKQPDTAEEAIADVVERALEAVPFSAVFVPTHSGTTARLISRFKPPTRIVAVSPNQAVCRALAFSYGVSAVHLPEEPDDWESFAAGWLHDHGINAQRAILVTGPSPRNPDTNYRIEFLRFGPSRTGD